jgi:histidinol-phosphate aminotransferase
LSSALAGVALHRYPDARATELLQALSRWSGAPAGALVAGTGSDELLGLLFDAWGEPGVGRERPVAVIPAPSFVMYRRRALLRGWDVVEVPLGADFELDAGALWDACERWSPNLVFLASPNNPTGRPVPPAAVLGACARTPHGLVVLDEAYGDFSGAPRLPRPSPDNLVRVGTLSKVGLAALRVGWAEAAPHVHAALEAVRAPFNVAGPSQVAAAAVLNGLSVELRAHVQDCVARRDLLAEALASEGCARVTPSEANFLWVQPVQPAAAVHAGLLARGIRVAHLPGAATGGCLRVTVGTARENAALLEAWRACAIRPA